MEKSSLKQIFDGMLLQAFDALEAKGGEPVVKYNITQEEGGTYYIEVDGFCCIGRDSNEMPNRKEESDGYNN